MLTDLGAAARAAYYPTWLGASSGAASADRGSAATPGIVHGTGSIFASSALPDIGGMFSSLGSIGSTPPSTSSSGGGFSGGSSSGGGGSSGSF